MLKRCTNCESEYVARWRNEPTTLCYACRLDVVLCSACAKMIRPPYDANQLTLWPILIGWRGPQQPPTHEPHFSHGRLATQAEKRKAPYH